MYASPHNLLIRHCVVVAILVSGAAHAKDPSEDREAAVYDRAVIATAHAQKHAVAFFTIRGQVTSDEMLRRAVIAALESAGDKNTARVSLPSAACSVAFDPAVTSMVRLAAHADQALEGVGLTLEPLRMTSEGDALADAK